MNADKMILLIIMDGFGIGEKNEGNAVYKANTFHLDKVFKENPYTELFASGEYVGLPKGQMGNSEVGHLNMGAGRIVYQDLTYINKCIDDNSFYKNEELINIIKFVKEKNSTLHLMGLLSDGGIHSHINHWFAVLKLAKTYGLNKVCVHVWSDGRDTAPKSGISYVKKLQKFMQENKIGKIETVSGRYYAMDRDKNWSRTRLAYDAIAYGIGPNWSEAEKAMEKSYENNITDEFIIPCVRENYKGIEKNDGIICLNFRPDRARQITKMFTSDIADVSKTKTVSFGKYCCFTCYDASFSEVSIAFKPRVLKNTLGEYLSKCGISQLRVAETEKYAHVTFFFNGGVEKPYKNEERVIVNSLKVNSYDLTPEMSANQVTEEVLKGIKSEKYNLIVVNFANPDMVGHTGNMDSAIKAVEKVDECVGILIDQVKEHNGIAIITADHGNAEKMKDDLGNPFTAHTSNKVPFAVVGTSKKLKENCSLCDISPTILKLLGIKKPREMSGQSII